MGYSNPSKLLPKGSAVTEICYEPGRCLRLRIEDSLSAIDQGFVRVRDVVFAGVEQIDMTLAIEDGDPRIECTVHRLRDAAGTGPDRVAIPPLGVSVRTSAGTIAALCRSVEEVLLEKSQIESARNGEDRRPD